MVSASWRMPEAASTAQARRRRRVIRRRNRRDRPISSGSCRPTPASNRLECPTLTTRRPFVSKWATPSKSPKCTSTASGKESSTARFVEKDQSVFLFSKKKRNEISHGSRWDIFRLPTSNLSIRREQRTAWTTKTKK